jgi:hypothetical protein
VRIHEYPDGMLAVFHGPRKLAEYHENGSQLHMEKTTTNTQKVA